jgi:hypothetical protein
VILLSLSTIRCMISMLLFNLSPFLRRWLFPVLWQIVDRSGWINFVVAFCARRLNTSILNFMRASTYFHCNTVLRLLSILELCNP